MQVYVLLSQVHMYKTTNNKDNAIPQPSSDFTTYRQSMRKRKIAVILCIPPSYVNKTEGGERSGGWGWGLCTLVVSLSYQNCA